MKFIVFTNWDERFLEGLDPSVIEYVSGRLSSDHVGSSAFPFEVFGKRAGKKQLEKHVKKLHARKIRFNYLLDGHCTGNREYSWKGNEAIFNTIKWISDIGVDAVTVSMPHLVQVLRENFPKLNIGFGDTRVICEIAPFKYYKQQGAKWLILNPATNRNFKLLKALASLDVSEMWLTLNSGCLFSCPFGFDHDNFLSHASNFTAGPKTTDYFHANCFSVFLKDTRQLMRSPWIRPEDMILYENIGFKKFIIYPNSPETKIYLNIINAYKNRCFEGNFVELLSVMGRPFKAVKINNRDLDEFLPGFIEKSPDCSELFCDECGYCDLWLKECLRIDLIQKRRLIRKYERIVERMGI
ncbi:MAG TPA: U32 family peptidase [Candidatus Omnitrophota bacterium]|nr:U32 family peptidase [Candidatus Omnitrophota bacterium]